MARSILLPPHLDVAICDIKLSGSTRCSQLDGVRSDRQPGGVVELGGGLDREARHLFRRKAGIPVSGVHRAEREVGVGADGVELEVFLHRAVRAHAEDAVRVGDQHVDTAGLTGRPLAAVCKERGRTLIVGQARATLLRSKNGDCFRLPGA